MDPLFFADPDPDPGSQNLEDPTDPDPKHCLEEWLKASFIKVVSSLLETPCFQPNVYQEEFQVVFTVSFLGYYPEPFPLLGATKQNIKVFMLKFPLNIGLGSSSLELISVN